MTQKFRSFLELVFVCVTVGATGCQRNEMPPEPIFSEEFGVPIELPMAETDFVGLLEEEGISYETMIRAPQPRDPDAATGQISRAIAVYGELDAELGRQAGYHAFVDSNGEVILIENSFSYVAPAPCLFSCAQ